MVVRSFLQSLHGRSRLAMRTMAEILVGSFDFLFTRACSNSRFKAENHVFFPWWSQFYQGLPHLPSAVRERGLLGEKPPKMCSTGQLDGPRASSLALRGGLPRGNLMAWMAISLRMQDSNRELWNEFRNPWDRILHALHVQNPLWFQRVCEREALRYRLEMEQR